MASLSDRIKAAQSASAEGLWDFVRDHHPQVLLNAAINRNLTEDMAVLIAKNTAAPSEALGFLAADVRFKDSYKLTLSISRNPKSPPKTTLSLLKFLRIFDLASLTKDPYIPVNLRQKIEQMLAEKIPSMPEGVKTALARKANSSIVVMLMEKGSRSVISSCLESPVITEGHLYKLISMPQTKPLVIKMIAEHPRWSLRYALRFGLIRNFHTPMSPVIDFIADMKGIDLKYLYHDPKLPTATRPFIFRELMERNETLNEGRETIHELNEDDIED